MGNSIKNNSLKDCPKLNENLVFFQDLILAILTRRIVFKKIEDEMKKTTLTEHNDVMFFIWYGYIISQLSDCRKFFDRDGSAYSFQFVVKHLNDSTIENKHQDLFQNWKDEKLETVLNKYMLHADKRASEINTEVSVKSMNKFIDNLENYLKEIVDDLNKNYSGIGSMSYDGYLKDREGEVDTFFDQIKK